ncbi:AMP-binding protein [Parasphingorhabdus sp.]|uniref:AMP-binding protein n=1 Tax=Parasphingorhabdus sp. TaxID=2709688 RepID=UPI003A94BF4D
MIAADASTSLFVGRNFRWLLETRAQESCDKDALIWRDLEGGRRRWTYAELLADVDKVARGFQDRGIAKGAAVCLFLDNRPEFLLSWFALASIGAVTVAINSRSSASELAYFLTKSKAVAVITQPHSLDTVSAAITPETNVAQLIVVDEQPLPAAVIPAEHFSALLASESDPQIPEIAPDDPAMVQFTSGTTSRPKGVVWTHANLLWGGKISSGHEKLISDDRHLTLLPLFHTNAQSYSVLASLWVGATVILMPRFSTSRFWPIAVEEKATWCSITWFGIKALLGVPVPPDHSFRYFGNGANIEAWRRHSGIPMVGWWGMTETVTHGIVSDPDLPCPSGAIGFPAIEYGLRILSDEDGQPLDGPGTGLLEIKGVQGVSTALEYLDEPEATAAAWHEDGWFETGDRVALNEDGSITFMEREKDVIKVGGENVASLEVERVISRTPGVLESAVVAGPHRMLQEIPVAFVVPERPGEDVCEAVRAACEEHLADFKCPRHIFLVDTLPRGTLDKVAKAALRKRAGELVEANCK